METISEDVVIVGAGIARLATAVALKRVGIRALLLERSDELPAKGAALNLFPNAWVALHALGVAHKLTSVYSAIQKGCVTDVTTGATQVVNFAEMDRMGMGPRPVHRKALVEALAEELPVGQIRFSSKLVGIETQALDDSSTTAVLLRQDGTIIKAKVVIGCDGRRSVVARWLGFTDRVHSGRCAVLGVAKFPEEHGFNRDAHQFVGEGKRGGCIPLNDKEVLWFMTYVSSSSTGKEMGQDPELMQKFIIEDVARDFQSRYLDVVRHSDLATLTWVPLKLRLPWDLIFGKASKGTITVAGDAMHPMTPDLGQGGCAALEDAVVLGRNIGVSFLQNGSIVAGEVSRAIQSYVKERRWRVAGLITGSYMSGWAQQGGSGWRKFVRDVIFYKLFFPRIADATDYDCGMLPTAVNALNE